MLLLLLMLLLLIALAAAWRGPARSCGYTTAGLGSTLQHDLASRLAQAPLLAAGDRAAAPREAYRQGVVISDFPTNARIAFGAEPGRRSPARRIARGLAAKTAAAAGIADLSKACCRDAAARRIARGSVSAAIDGALTLASLAQYGAAAADGSVVTCTLHACRSGSRARAGKDDELLTLLRATTKLETTPDRPEQRQTSISSRGRKPDTAPCEGDS